MKKITLKKDLTDIKISDKKKIVANIILKWRRQISKQRELFRDEFLSEKHDKYFEALKDIIGDFKELKKINISDFIYEIVVLGQKSKYKVCREIYEMSKLN